MHFAGPTIEWLQRVPQVARSNKVGVGFANWGHYLFIHIWPQIKLPQWGVGVMLKSVILLAYGQGKWAYQWQCHELLPGIELWRLLDSLLWLRATAIVGVCCTAVPACIDASFRSTTVSSKCAGGCNAVGHNGLTMCWLTPKSHAWLLRNCWTTTFVVDTCWRLQATFDYKSLGREEGE